MTQTYQAEAIESPVPAASDLPNIAHKLAYDSTGPVPSGKPEFSAQQLVKDGILPDAKSVISMDDLEKKVTVTTDKQDDAPLESGKDKPTTKVDHVADSIAHGGETSSKDVPEKSGHIVQTIGGRHPSDTVAGTTKDDIPTPKTSDESAPPAPVDAVSHITGKLDCQL